MTTNGRTGPGSSRRPLLLVGIAAVLLVAFVGAVAVTVGLIIWRLTDSSGLGPTDSLVVRLAPPSGAPAPSDDELLLAMDLLEARALDLSATKKADVRRDGDTIVVGMEGIGEPDRAVDLLAARGELRFRPVLEAIPAEQLDELDPSVSAPQQSDVVVLEGNDGQRYILGPTLATGDIIETAEADLDQTGNWIVSLLFRSGSAGIDQFNEAASLCFSGGQRCPTQTLAIVVDSQVQSAPMVQQPSFGRDGVIITWADVTQEEARDLALLLRHPALPIELEAQSTD